MTFPAIHSSPAGPPQARRVHVAASSALAACGVVPVHAAESHGGMAYSADAGTLSYRGSRWIDGDRRVVLYRCPSGEASARKVVRHFLALDHGRMGPIMAPANDAAVPETLDLSALLAAVAGGDQSAFERLYRSTSSRLFGICARLLRDRAEAEDALQEVFTIVWHKAGQFDAARASAITWLAMIARNKCIDRLRSNANLRRNTAIELAEAIADGGPDGFETTERLQDQRRLDACLQALEPHRQTLLRTAFFEGATYEELALRSNTPLGTVKSWIRRSLQKLKACLEA